MSDQSIPRAPLVPKRVYYAVSFGYACNKGSKGANPERIVQITVKRIHNDFNNPRRSPTFSVSMDPGFGMTTASMIVPPSLTWVHSTEISEYRPWEAVWEYKKKKEEEPQKILPREVFFGAVRQLFETIVRHEKHPGGLEVILVKWDLTSVALRVFLQQTQGSWSEIIPDGISSIGISNVKVSIEDFERKSDTRGEFDFGDTGQAVVQALTQDLLKRTSPRAVVREKRDPSAPRRHLFDAILEKNIFQLTEAFPAGYYSSIRTTPKRIEFENFCAQVGWSEFSLEGTIVTSDDIKHQFGTEEEPSPSEMFSKSNLECLEAQLDSIALRKNILKNHSIIHPSTTLATFKGLPSSTRLDECLLKGANTLVLASFSRYSLYTIGDVRRLIRKGSWLTALSALHAPPLVLDFADCYSSTLRKKNVLHTKGKRRGLGGRVVKALV